MFDIANTTVSDLTWPSIPTHVSLDQLSSGSLNRDTFVFAWDLLKQQLVLSNLWKILLVLHIAANFKNFPFVYHLRILNAVRFVLSSQRPKQDVKPDQLFQPLITSSKACLAEIDVYGHKSNSTYFADVDIARAHLVTTLFGRGISKIRGGTTMNGLSGKKTSAFTMALGGVSCSFKRELRPYETYDMWTRILSWDEKWIYMVTHFVKKGANITPREYTLYPKQKILASGTPSRQGSMAEASNTPRGSVSGPSRAQQPSPIAASALSKIVFKEGRKTIAPTVMFELSGLLPPRATEEKVNDLAAAQIEANAKEVSPIEPISPLQKVEVSDSDDSDLSRRNSIEGKLNEWSWDKIEAERQRGLKLAQLLSKQTALEEEFTDDAALGRHYDGYGIEGVVSTLAQLGGFSKYQLL